MANFSYNRDSNESRLSQYGKYLQNQNYVNQIDCAIRETGEMQASIVAIQSKEVQNAIDYASEQNRESIIYASNAICSSLDSGFSSLYYSLGDIKDEIHGLSNLVGHGLSLLVEGQKFTNKYLGKIQNLFRIPDSQKQRVYHIDEGMKYLQNAFRQDPESDFYTDALDEFQAALAIEKKDFFSLYHIGFIYLKSTKHLDPKNAEIFFRNSARYYLAEALVSGTNVSNNLLQSHKGFLLEAAEALLFAGEACYVQEKFSEAAELAAEAWKTFPDMTKAGFFQSKYLAANKQVDAAIKILEKTIRINRFLSMEVIIDLDLNSKPEIINLIEKLKVEALQEARTNYVLCNNKILSDSIATSYLASIAKLINLETFLDAKEATYLLLISKTWTINSGANITTEGQIIAKISSHDFSGNVIDFINFERERVLAIPKASNLIRIEKIEKQKRNIQEELNPLLLEYNKLESNLIFDLVVLGIIIFAFLIIIIASPNSSQNSGVNILAVSKIVIFICFLLFIVLGITKGPTILSLKSEIKKRENSINNIDNEIKQLLEKNSQ